MSHYDTINAEEFCLISHPKSILYSKKSDRNVAISSQNENSFDQNIVNHFKTKIEDINDILRKLNSNPKVKIKQEDWSSDESVKRNAELKKAKKKIKKRKKSSGIQLNIDSPESEHSEYEPIDIESSEDGAIEENTIEEVVYGCGPSLPKTEPKINVEPNTNMNSSSEESDDSSFPKINLHLIETRSKPNCAKLALTTMLKVQKLSYQKAILLYTLKHNATKDVDWAIVTVDEDQPPPPRIHSAPKIDKRKRQTPLIAPESAEKLENGKYKCNFCKKIVSSRYIRDHVNSLHKGLKLYTCSICGEVLSTRNILARHVLDHKNPIENKFPCFYCDKVYKRLQSRRRHYDTFHKDIKKYVCPKCQKRFISKGKLTAHLGSKHDGEKPFQCDRCGKSYSQKVSLDYHIKTHSDNSKPFSCKVCDKSYTSKYSMLNHFHTHSKAQGFLCSVCGKSFPIKSHMLKHKCKSLLS